MLGNWRDFDELETSLCIDELIMALDAKHKHEHQQRKFMAALKGIDIDEGKQEEPDPWQEMKNRVFGKRNSVKDDIMLMQGNGIDYEEVVA